MADMKKENLIKVTVNQPGYEYDIHALVKAFYPACDVKVSAEEPKAVQILDSESSPEGKRKEEGGEPFLPELDIEITEETVFIRHMCHLQDAQPAASPAFGEKEKRFSAAGTETDVMYRIELEPNMPRPEIKNRLKRLLYKILSQETEKSLPWGTLTGIRPTKISMTMLEEGKEEKEILNYMKDTYLISQEKGELSIQIARREKALLETLDYRDGYSLYIGIPFCPTTCLYCSFTSYPIVSWRKRTGEYLDALEKEIDFTAEQCRGKKLETIYIGGGTPTTLEPWELQRLLEKIHQTFDLSSLKEFTVEAGRADSITPDKLRVLREQGITRISVNPQTMKQETLDFIGRKHTVGQVRDAFSMAREAGFDNINMDIILGLPGENAADVRMTMEEIEKLGPESLTVHSLAIKRASKLSQWITQNGISALNNTDEMMNITAAGAESMGMAPYYLYRQKNMSGNFENVGYAKEGKYGIYNILIMEEKQNIVALGAGSISKRVYSNGQIERCENVKEVAQYIERIDEMIERKRVLLED